jgi:regulator of replication initiation timing
MIKEPTNESFFYSQIGALEAEVERVKKENHKLQSQNTILKTRLYLNKISYETGDEDGKG